MKRNMFLTMEKLEIDDKVKDLVRQLWKHCYRTTDSCEGHNSQGYIIFTGGDGWFEENASQWGLEKYANNLCCETEEDVEKCCVNCGAGINGNSIYRGNIVQNPMKPKF